MKAHIRTNPAKYADVLLTDVKPVHMNGKEYKKFHTGVEGDEAHRVALMETYAEWYAFSMSNLFLHSNSYSGFSRTSMLRALGSRTEKFPEFGIVTLVAQQCKIVGRDICPSLGAMAAYVR